jgi:hypothetical protein
VRWSVCSPIHLASLLSAVLFLAGCGPSVNRYLLVEQSLIAGDPVKADTIIAQAENEYGSKNLVLYAMDRGMLLHLAGQYQQSNALLDQAEHEIDRLYTRSIRNETAAFLSNDNVLPYEGDPYEQVMINVAKALNYAAQGLMQEALVEARRIDHRLNVLADRAKDAGGYRADGFARYLTGILYEAAGDLNNAFIAYRNAYEAYLAMQGWARTPVPDLLPSDLLRLTEALHLTTEFEQYRRSFPETTWQPLPEQQQLAQVVLISYNGRAPRKEDLFLDLPISLDALQLVLLNRGVFQFNRQQNRAADSVLYGLNGRVVRVALPRLVPRKTQVPYEQMTLTNDAGYATTVRSVLAQNLTALAERTLSDRMPGITMKALARAATKYTLAEGMTRGAQQAVGRDAAPWVGLAVGLITKGFAVASEEADKRIWETLPDEIHIARSWVTPGRYEVSVRPAGTGPGQRQDGNRTLDLTGGQTAFVIQRVMQ